MELKRIAYELTVCKVADVSDIDMKPISILLGKQMKKYLWCAKRKIPRPILLIEMMDGKASMFREYLIFH